MCSLKASGRDQLGESFMCCTYIPAWFTHVCDTLNVLSSQGSDAGQGQRSDQQDGGAGQGRMWKKKHQEARVRREYRTADEVVRETSELRPEAVLAAQPILDMRGPQVRLVTNLAHLNVKVRSTSLSMGELRSQIGDSSGALRNN